MRQKTRCRWYAVSAVSTPWLLASLGCASSSTEALLPPQSLAIERPAPAEPPAAVTPLEPVPPAAGTAGEATTSAPTSASREPAREAGSSTAGGEDGTVVVLDRSNEAGQEDTATLLRELSRSERERRQSAPPARLVLTDANVAASGEGARVTFSGGTTASPPAADAVAAAAPAAATAEGAADVSSEGTSEEERYWRSRALEIRQRWRSAHDDVPRLEGEVERLRTAFYAEDDPVRRDRQVKPLWDRALDRLQETRAEVERAQEDLESLLAEGTSEGALPGWLREGIELEPPYEGPAAEGEGLAEADPEEPVTVEPESREPPAR